MDEGGCRAFQGLKEWFWYLLASSASNGSQREISQDLLGYWAAKNVPGDIWLICNRLYRSYQNFSIVVPLWSKRKKKLKLSPQIRILLPLGSSFQNFSDRHLHSVDVETQIHRSLPFFRPTRRSAKIFVRVRNCMFEKFLSRNFTPKEFKMVVFSFPSFLWWVGYSFV